MSLDTTKRTNTIAEIQEKSYDLLVIGGGITGAGIALDAASRGLKTLMLEMQDFGAGTSSRSTKLIHGGLRYLKQFEFRLVREVGRERAILFANAPHIVVPEKMLLPIMKGGTFGRLGVRVGLWFYDRLAGVDPDERRRMLSKAETLRKEPLLKVQGLKGAGLYTEYRTDDARLVAEVTKTAVREGATCLNYSKITELQYQDGKVAGAKVTDQLTGQMYTVRARYVANAAGPWVDGLRDLDGSLAGKRLHHTKGTHIVLERKRMPVKHSAYIDASDGRMIFVIPRDNWVYVGTTDTNYAGDLQHPRGSAEDVKYLLEAANAQFPDVKLVQEDVVSSWAGIRPLIHEEGKSPSELSRKDELFFSDTGLITIAGGKLTGFRRMAEKVVDVVVRRAVMDGVLRSEIRCKTDKIRLAGGVFAGPPAIRTYIGRMESEYGVARKEITWLVGLYGSNTARILEMMQEEEGSEKVALVKAALRYSVKEEAVATLSDFFVRRTALLYFGRSWIAPVLEAVSARLQELVGEEQDIDPGGIFQRDLVDAVDFPPEKNL